MDPRKKQILQTVVTRGPQSERALRRLGPFNPGPLRKWLAELVEEGCLRKDQTDEKGWKLRPGNPQFYHITIKGVKLVFPTWKWMGSAWRARFVHADSHKDLGIVPSLMNEVAEAQASRNVAEGKLFHRDMDILDLQDEVRRLRGRERKQGQINSLSEERLERERKAREKTSHLTQAHRVSDYWDGVRAYLDGSYRPRTLAGIAARFVRNTSKDTDPQIS